MKKEVKRNERDYGYIEFIAGPHDHIVTRIWVANDMIQTREESHPLGFGGNAKVEKRVQEYIEFPCTGYVHQTEKGSLILKPTPEGTVFYVEIRSGYRGTADFTKFKSRHNCFVAATGKEYHSPQGRLGETAWAVVQTDGSFLEVRGERTGRRVDEEEVAFRLYTDGTRENLVVDNEVCSILEGR